MFDKLSFKPATADTKLTESTIVLYASHATIEKVMREQRIEECHYVHQGPSGRVISHKKGSNVEVSL